MRYPFIFLLLLLSLLPLSTQALELSWVGCGITRNAFMADLAAAYKEKTGVDITIAGGGATKGIREITSKQATKSFYDGEEYDRNQLRFFIGGTY